MYSSIEEGRIADSPEAYEAAIYHAKGMVNALKKTYTDEMVKMAFEIALNESSDSIFQAIYESACVLREDAAPSFAKFARKIQPTLGNDPAMYGAAVFYRLSDMAEDNKIMEASLNEFLGRLKSNGLKDSMLISMSTLYFYLVKYKESFQTLKLKSLDVQTKGMYDDYMKLSPRRQEAYKKRIQDEWWKIKKAEEEAAKKHTGFLDMILGRN